MKITLTINKRLKLKKPIMICAWPGMGEVAFKLAVYLKNKLPMEQFASLDAQELFPPSSIWIENSVIQMPKDGFGRFYSYRHKEGGSDVILFISDGQPLLEHAAEYAEKILGLAKDFKVKRLYTFAAMPVPIYHTAAPEVWITATSKKIINELNEGLGLKILTQGQISGLNGIILGLAAQWRFEGACLLGEIPLFTVHIENPKASLAVLNKIAKILRINVDTQELEEQVKLMEQEIEKLLDLIQSPDREGAGASAPIGDEEIEKIKKTLSLYTKLPKSARSKIETLFKEAKVNIDKATELKKELDIWNVYKEYEDRFLDLFKKTNDQGDPRNN